MAGWGNNNGRTNFCAARRTSAGHEKDEREREAEREEEDEEEARFHDTAREEDGRIPKHRGNSGRECPRKDSRAQMPRGKRGIIRTLVEHS